MEASIKLQPGILEQNIEAWSRWDAKHAIQLQFLDTEQFYFTQTKKKELNLCKGETAYHDPAGALDEAVRWFDSIDLQRFSLIYVFGVGIGYLYLAAKNWLDQSDKNRLVFLENDLGVIAKLFETDIGSEILQNPKVRISFFNSVLHDKAPFQVLFWKFLATPFTVQALPAYQRNSPEIYEELKHKLIYDASINNGILDEYYKYGIIFYKNFYHLILRLPGCFQASALFDQFKDKPAIICGAGPSLALHFEQLKKLQNRALIMAGGSALNALNSADIMPHFGAGIDPNPAQYDRYRTNKAYELPFFFRTRLYHKAFDILHGPKIYVTGSGGYSITKYVEERLDIQAEDASEGFNVINFLIDLAQKLGCNPIILVGMDLGYTGMKTYAPGIVEDVAVSEEHFDKGTYYDEQVLLKSDIYGKPFYTLWKWIAESEWIDDYAKEHPAITLLNATEGGLGCGDVPNVTLEEAVKRYCTEEFDYHSFVHSIVESAPLNISRDKIDEIIKVLKNSLERCIELLDLLIDETGKAKGIITQGGELGPSFQTGAAIYAESELAEEDAFVAVISDFNDMYNMTIHGEIDEAKHILSEKELSLKKMEIQEKKYKFLKEVAKANILSIDWATKEEKENG